MLRIESLDLRDSEPMDLDWETEAEIDADDDLETTETDPESHVGNQRVLIDEPHEFLQEFSQEKNIFRRKQGGKSMINKVLNGISRTGQVMMSPSQVGARIAKKSVLRAVQEMEQPEKDSLQFSDYSEMDIDDVYSETPSKKNRGRKTSRDFDADSNGNGHVTPVRAPVVMSSTPLAFGPSFAAALDLELDSVVGDGAADGGGGSVNAVDSAAHASSPTPAYTSSALAAPAALQTATGFRTPLQLHNHYHYHEAGPAAAAATTGVRDGDHIMQDHVSSMPPAYIISQYLQVVFNAAAMAAAAYLAYAMWHSVRGDIADRVQAKAELRASHVDSCREFYVANHCDAPVPALAEQCREWRRCWSRPTSGRYYATVGAETLGVVFNSLAEPIGLKAFGVMVIVLGWYWGWNFFFGYVRGRHEAQEMRIVKQE